VGSVTVSGFINIPNAVFNSYVLLFQKVLPVNNGATLQMKLSIDNGSTFLAAGYESGNTFNDYNSTGFGNVNSSSLITCGTFSNTTEGFGWIYFSNFANGFTPCMSGVTINTGRMALLQCQQANTSGINALEFFFDSGNIQSMSATLFGVRG